MSLIGFQVQPLSTWGGARAFAEVFSGICVPPLTVDAVDDEEEDEAALDLAALPAAAAEAG